MSRPAIGCGKEAAPVLQCLKSLVPAGVGCGLSRIGLRRESIMAPRPEQVLSGGSQTPGTCLAWSVALIGTGH